MNGTVIKEASETVEKYTSELFLRLRNQSFSVKIENTGTGAQWRLGIPKLIYDQMGRDNATKRVSSPVLSRLLMNTAKHMFRTWRSFDASRQPSQHRTFVRPLQQVTALPTSTQQDLK